MKCAAIDALGSYISSIEPKHVKHFTDLLPILLQQTVELLNKDLDSGVEALEVIADLAGTESKFFRKDFELFFKTMEQIILSKSYGSNVHNIALEALMGLLEKLYSCIRNSEDMKRRLVELIFLKMIDIDSEVDSDWEKPAEGFIECIEDDDDFHQTNTGMGYISELISNVGDKEMIPIISTVIQQMLEQQDWRYVYSAIMALSSVGDYIKDVAEVSPITITVLKFMKYPNPKVR